MRHVELTSNPACMQQSDRPYSPKASQACFHLHREREDDDREQVRSVTSLHLSRPSQIVSRGGIWLMICSAYRRISIFERLGE